MPLEPFPEPNVVPPDHVPDELVLMYGREASQAVRYSRTRRYHMSKRVRKARTSLRDAELWSTAGLVFFWGVAALALIGGLVYAVLLWPAAGIALTGTLAVLVAISLSVGMHQSRRRRTQPADKYTSYSF